MLTREESSGVVCSFLVSYYREFVREREVSRLIEFYTENSQLTYADYNEETPTLRQGKHDIALHFIYLNEALGQRKLEVRFVDYAPLPNGCIHIVCQGILYLRGQRRAFFQTFVLCPTPYRAHTYNIATDYFRVIVVEVEAIPDGGIIMTPAEVTQHLLKEQQREEMRRRAKQEAAEEARRREQEARELQQLQQLQKQQQQQQQQMEDARRHRERQQQQQQSQLPPPPRRGRNERDVPPPPPPPPSTDTRRGYRSGQNDGNHVNGDRYAQRPENGEGRRRADANTLRPEERPQNGEGGKHQEIRRGRERRDRTEASAGPLTTAPAASPNTAAAVVNNKLNNATNNNNNNKAAAVAAPSTRRGESESAESGRPARQRGREGRAKPPADERPLPRSQQERRTRNETNNHINNNDAGQKNPNHAAAATSAPAVNSANGEKHFEPRSRQKQPQQGEGSQMAKNDSSTAFIRVVRVPRSIKLTDIQEALQKVHSEKTVDLYWFGRSLTECVVELSSSSAAERITKSSLAVMDSTLSVVLFYP